LIGDRAITAQILTALGMMTVLLATDGSRCVAGAVVLCPRYGSITGNIIAIVIRVTLSSRRSKRRYETEDQG